MKTARQTGRDDPRSDGIAAMLPDSHVRSIFVIGQQHFVAGRQGKTLGHDVHGERGVVDQYQVIRGATDELP